MLRRIGRYQIVRLLGGGGMGEVYLAVDPSIGRNVAIKTILLRKYGDTSDKDFLLERLHREARSAGTLSHPNIVTIHDFVEQGELACLVMEYIEGKTLRELVRSDEALDPETAISVLRQTAVALDYAHSKGVIHRDIKPANIIMQKSGLAKILDFGVAKLPSSHSLTETGFSVGTPDYMSPEQYRVGPVDGRADQFSLAVIAFEMLTGVQPFAADTPLKVMYKVIHEQPPCAEELNSSLIPEVGRVLCKALEKDPSSRFESCGHFVEALEGALERAPGWRAVTRQARIPRRTPRAVEVAAEEETAASGETPSPPPAAPPAEIKPVEPEPRLEEIPLRRTPIPGPPTPRRTPVPPKKPTQLGNVLAALGGVLLLGLFVLVAFKPWFNQSSSNQKESRPVETPVEKLKPLAITTPSVLPEGSQGGAYSQVAMTSGGSPPTHWSVSSGDLPAGLSIESATGLISGTPARAGQYQFTLRATDNAQTMATQEFSLRVNPASPTAAPLPRITTASLPGGAVGKAYSHRLQASGGSPPYRWSARAETLPPGLALDSETGTLDGTPQRAGTFKLSVQVTDTDGANATRGFSFTATPRLTIDTPPELPAGTVKGAYSQPLKASGGEPPYSWSLETGTLPPELSLDSSREMILGTPTSEDKFDFTLRVTDRAGASATQSFTFTASQIIPPPVIKTSGTLQRGITGMGYSQMLSASGGRPPYNWSVASGALPPGLSLDSAKGLIGGTPTRAGPYQFSLGMTDSAPAPAKPQQVSLRVVSQLVILSPTLLPTATAGRSYAYALAAVGGSPSYRWSLAGGSLPPDLSLDSSRGVIDGTPAKTGQFRFKVRVSDGDQETPPADFTLTVTPLQGEIVWQGELEINAPLIIQGRYASRGTLSGELPGTPVKLEVLEPPGVSLVKPPGPGVGWKNMVLNSPHQKQTRIVLRWTEIR